VRSLLVRIFLSFWLIIGITIGAAALAGYYYAERLRVALENFDPGDTLVEASSALSAGGRAGLESWLREANRTGDITIYVFDSEGREMLGRTPPRRLARVLHRHGSRSGARGDPMNLRRARPHSQLVSADGEVYTLLFSPLRRPAGIRPGLPTGSSLLVLVLVVSGVVSYLLARAISNPVRKLRHATVSLAEGRMDSRVASSVGDRRDELGMLARDFDAMAEKLQRAAAQQTELSRNVSHELRSPLARLRVAAELAKRKAGNLPEFEHMDEETERLDRLIGQILSYARLESGAQLERTRVNLSELVQEVVDNVNFECRSGEYDGVRVVSYTGAVPEFTGYAQALTSAIENIVRNAVRHSPPGGTVVVRLASRDQRATIEVLDDGKGVGDDELPRLFEPFFRTRSAALDSNKRGTGLGLAIAERAIRINGGTVTAANRTGGGLQVLVTLPLDREHAG
jgi:two-component system, OmpR family, sensor kinase